MVKRTVPLADSTKETSAGFAWKSSYDACRKRTREALARVNQSARAPRKSRKPGRMVGLDAVYNTIYR